MQSRVKTNQWLLPTSRYVNCFSYNFKTPSHRIVDHPATVIPMLSPIGSLRLSLWMKLKKNSLLVLLIGQLVNCDSHSCKIYRWELTVYEFLVGLIFLWNSISELQNKWMHSYNAFIWVSRWNFILIFLKFFNIFFGFVGLIISIIHFTVSQIIHKYVYNYCTCNGNIMNPQFIVYHVYPSIFSGLLISSKCQPWVPKIVDFWIYQAHYPYSISHWAVFCLQFPR